MTVGKILGAASVVVMLAAPISVIADETGGAAGNSILDWMKGPSAVEGVKNGTLAGLGLAAGAGLGFGLNEAIDDNDSRSSATTTTTTTTN